MRIILLLLLIIPSIAFAQINRSATILAKENIEKYVGSILFKDKPYASVSYGVLKHKDDDRNYEVNWVISHKFEITETETDSGKKIKVHKPYVFYFFLDRKMEVKRAEGYYIN